MNGRNTEHLHFALFFSVWRFENPSEKKFFKHMMIVFTLTFTEEKRTLPTHLVTQSYKLSDPPPHTTTLNLLFIFQSQVNL